MTGDPIYDDNGDLVGHAGEPFHASDGTPLGYLHEADDGALVVIDDDGNVLAASTTAGQELDPGGYEVNDYEIDEPGYQEDPDLDRRLTTLELRQRIDELRAQMTADGIIPNPDEPTADELTEEFDRLQADVAHQAMGLQATLGRDLTLNEVQAIGETVAHETRHGRDPNVYGAYMDAIHEGKVRTFDLANRQDRIDFAMERVADQAEPREPPASPDLDDREQRVQFMTDRYTGVTGPTEQPQEAA